MCPCMAQAWSLEVVLIDKLLMLLTEHEGTPLDPSFRVCMCVCELGTIFFCASPPNFALAYFVVKLSL